MDLKDTETNADSNFKCGPKWSHVNFFGSEGVLKAQAEPFPVLLSRALFRGPPPRHRRRRRRRRKTRTQNANTAR